MATTKSASAGGERAERDLRALATELKRIEAALKRARAIAARLEKAIATKLQ